MENVPNNKSTHEEIAELESQKLEAQATFDGEKEGQLEAKIQELKKSLEVTTETAITTPEYQVNQVNELGGSQVELSEKVKEVDKEIEKVKDGVDNQKEKSESLLDALKQEKFDKLEAEYLKFYKEEPTVSYNLQNLSKEFKIYNGNISPKELEETDSFISSVPKSVIDEMINSKDSTVDVWKVRNSVEQWKSVIGQKINQMSNDREKYYDNTKNAIIENGIPKNAAQYLETVANAARFFPREVSEKFMQDAISSFIDSDKNEFTTGGKQIISIGGRLNENPKELNLLRNLIDSGYKNEAKQLITKSLQRYGYTMKILELEKLNLFSRDEIIEMTNEAGLLDEPKPKENNGWS